MLDYAALAVPLHEGHVVSSCGGLRSLVSTPTPRQPASPANPGRANPTVSLTVTRGRLTAHRQMVEDAVDLVFGQHCPVPSIAWPGRRAITAAGTVWSGGSGEAKRAAGAVTPADAAELRLRVTKVDPQRDPAVASVCRSPGSSLKVRGERRDSVRPG